MDPDVEVCPDHYHHYHHLCCTSSCKILAEAQANFRKYQHRWYSQRPIKLATLAAVIDAVKPSIV